MFASNRSSTYEIWVCNRDGSNAVQLTSFASPIEARVPVWSRDGQLIHFLGPSQDGETVSHVISSEEGKPKRSDRYPDGWSRDGKWMYFTSAAIQVTKNGGGAPAESPDGRYLYCLKRVSETTNSLWRLPLSGGEEAKVLDSVLHAEYAVGEKGIYFIPDTDLYSVRFLSFDTGKVATIVALRQVPAWGFSLSPDGRSLLYTRWEAKSDLMLVENFR